MAQYVRLPSGRFLELGPDESAQQALMRGMQQYPAEFNLEPEKQPQGGFGAAFSANLSRLAGETALTAGKAGILGLPEAEEIYRRQQEKAERIFKPTEKGWTEDPLQKLKEVAGGSAAYILAPAAAAGAAAFAPVTVPVIGAAGLAAGLTSLGQYTGSNIAAQMEENKKGLAETSGALATATAIPQAALDVLSFRMMPGIKKIFGATGKEVTEAQAKALAEQTLKQKIGDYTAATGVSMGVEGATEVAQDFLEKAQAGAELTDPKARADYLESLIGGAALAGVLGPFGRGFERAGIAARGRELEKERLTAEAAAKEKERLAALEEERAFRLTPPEGLVGPETPEALQQQRLQTRLAEIEQEVERARQAKDTDTLVKLFKERTALESQVAEEVPAFERMRGLQQRISGLENLAERLQREGLEAPTAADKRAIYARLVSTNKDLREAREELEKGIEKGELPTLVDYQQLLAKEKRALTNLSKAEDLKDDVKELKAATQLEESQQQLGLFGMESFAEKERFEAKQRRHDKASAAARGLSGATPIEMGINTDLFPTPPYRAGPYTQETLFGSPERVLTPSQTEMTIPQIQSTAARLGERTDLAPEDQALLERVENVAVPAPGVSIPEALQTRLTALQGVRQRIEQQLLQRGSPLLSEEEGAPAAEPEAAQKRTPAVFRTEDNETSYVQPDGRTSAVDRKGQQSEPVYTVFLKEQALKKAQQLLDSGVQAGKEPRFYLDVGYFQNGAFTPVGTLTDTVADIPTGAKPVVAVVDRANRTVIGVVPAETAPDVGRYPVKKYTETLSSVSAPIKNVQYRAEAAPAEEAKPAEAEAKPEPKATYKYMRDEYGNLVPILVESKKKAAPVAETTAGAEAEAKTETEVEEEERLSDAAKLKLLRQKVKVSPRVLSLDPSDRSESDLTERLQQRLRQNSMLSSLFNRLDRLDQIEKDLTEKLRSADRKAGTLLEKLTGRDEQNVTLRQRISDWLSDTAQGRGNEESRRALEEALLRVEQGQRGETQPLTTLKRRIATQEESKLLGGKKTVTERVPTGLTVTAQQPDLFAGTEAASAVEFETPKQMQAFMASEKLQKERAQKGEQALREAQEAGPPSPDVLKRVQQLLRPTVAYLKKQVVGLKNIIKRLNSRVDNYNTMLQVRTEEQAEALINAKKQLADVILAISKTLVSQHQKYAQAKLELDNAKNVYAGLDEFKKAVEKAMGQALDRASAFAGEQTALKERIEKDLAEKKAAFDAAFVKLRLLRDDIVDVDFGEARDKYLTPARQKMTEAVDPYTDLWPKYNLALKETQDAFKAIQDSLEENIGRPLTRSEASVVSDEEINNFLEQDAELTEMLIAQQRIVYDYEAQVAEAQRALDTARQEQEKDSVWSAFLKEAEAAIQAATDIPKKAPLTEPVALKNAIVAANKQIRRLNEQARIATNIQEQIRQLEEEKDSITRRIKASEDEVYLKELNLGLTSDALKLLNRKLIAARVTPLTLAEANVLAEKTTPLTKEEADALADFRKRQQKRREELERNVFTAEERAALENKTTTLQEIADNRRARIASIDQQINALRKELITTTIRGAQQTKAAQERAEKQAKTQAEIRAENERLERAAASALQVSGLTPEQREAVATIQKNIDTILKNKADAIAEKQAQTSNFQFSDELKKDVAAKHKALKAEVAKKLKAEKDKDKKTAIKEQAANDSAKIVADARELQRAADIKKLEEIFDAKVEKEQKKARVLREAIPTAASRREAQLRSALELQKDIGQPVKMTDEMAEAVLTGAEKKAVADGTKTLEQVMAERARQGRRGPVMRDVRTGRVSEPSKAPPTRDLPKAQQAKEQAEANRIAAEQMDAGDRILRETLTAFFRSPETSRVLGMEISVETLNETPIEELQAAAVQVRERVLEARAAERAKEEKRMAAVEKRVSKKKTRQDRAVEEFFDTLDRVISHDYAARENTPLDATTAAAVGKGDLKSALESLAENGSTPFVRMVAKRLLPMVENTTLETASGLVDEQGRLKGGDYYAKTDTIKLNKDALTEEDLIHEAGHAATIGVIDAKPDELTKEQLAARDALEKLYAKMQGRAEFKDEYGNVSFKEFVSELLSNQQVRDKINQTAGLLRRIYEGILRMLGMLGMRGIEPKTLSDKALEQAFEMFSPSKASANKQERLASIARGGFPGTATKYSSAVPKEVQDMVNRTIARTATLGDKITANATGLRMRTFIADNWAPVEALLKMGVEKAKIKEAQALQMRVYMRLFSNQQEYTNAALLNGVPELKTDDAGVRNIEGGDAKANAQTMAQALSKASKLGNQQAVERLFTMWMASLRAKQDGVGFDKLNFKKDEQPKPDELAKMEQMLKDNPDVKDAFEEARRLYKEHNKRLLNLQVQTGAMSQEVADELGKGDYVGYYRVKDNGVVELMLGGSRPMRIGSVVDQPYLKELVGGEQHILPFFSSMVQNTSMLMTIALRNMQNKNTAYMFQDLGLGKIHSVPEGQQAPASKIHFKQKGEEYWFDADEAAFSAAGVPADLMMQGLQGVKTTIPGLVRALAVPADILRKAVRRLPTYTLRQTIRDPMHAWMTTGGKFTPVLSTWKELAKGMTNTSQTQMTLKEAAIVGNNVFSGDTEGVAQMLRDLSSEPSRFSQIMMKLDEFAMKGEAATRAVLYDTFRQKGMGHVEALLNTAETMNFSRRGTSASLHWLSTLTPFFNAQIQGLDAVYRSLKGDTTFEEKMNARNMLLKRGALLAGSTMLYALMMEDDEAYKNATLAERYGNWFVRVPGTEATIRVPIPFELGLIFKSMPEAFVNTAFGDAKAKEAISALAKQAYMSSPFGIPTAVKGPLEIAFNYNMYSDQPIETAREKALDSDQRYRDSTTEVAKLLGKFGVLSPVQIDHLVRSYTSSTGIALLSMANFALRPLTTREGVEKPERALEEMPVVGALFQPKTGRGMVNAAFDDMHRIERAANTYKTLVASDPEAARAYADEYAKEISLSSFAGSFRQQMGEFAKYKRMVAANPDLTPAEKRAQIEAVKQQEIEYAKQLRKIAA